MSTSMTPADKIKALLAGMTPPPWTVETHTVSEFMGMKHTPARAITGRFLWGGDPNRPVPQSWENWHAVAALVNAAPQIVAALEAMGERHGRVMRTAQAEPSDLCRCGMVWLLCPEGAALAALEALEAPHAD